jgi:tetratricopeptide (TPR) repeat protein
MLRPLSFAFQNDFEVAYFLAALFIQRGTMESAIESLQNAVRIDPRHIEARYNLANALNQIGRNEDALDHYRLILKSNPRHANTLINYPGTLTFLGRNEEAVCALEMLIGLNPRNALLHLNRGVALHELGLYDEALESYERAASVNSDEPGLSYNRGRLLQQMARFDEALTSYDNSLSLKSDHAETWNNRGTTLLELARFEEALASYDKAIALKRGYAEAHFNKSLLLLLKGVFLDGWKKYEWRKKKKEPVGNRSYPQPTLSSLDDVANRTVLVHWEQGLGDTIQFCRYVPLLRERNARVLFAPQRQMQALMKTLDEQVELVNVDESLPDFDFHVPLLSLPGLFGTDITTIPEVIPQLFVDPIRVARWKQYIGSSGFKVGICWQGSTDKVDQGRSFPLSLLNNISKLPDLRLISLHKGEGEKQLTDLPLGMVVETLGDEFDAGGQAFLDAAASMMSLDLVITSDTAVAHLAGALGLPVWIALKHVPDWRWLLARDGSSWYPTARLFRQQKPADWAAVFIQIEAALIEVLQRRSGT